MRRFFSLTAVTILFLTGMLFRPESSSADMETTAVLPQGVFSPNFIFGIMTGVDQKFDDSGLLEGVTDQYHFDLTGDALAKMEPQLGQLVQELNNYSPYENLGSQLSMGTLDFSASPVISYFAPEIAYGLTPNFSIGVGIPIIHYQNNVQVVSSPGNVQALQTYLGNSNPQVADAIAQLVAAAANMESTLGTLLQSKGYDPLRAVDTVYAGDLQLSAVWRYYTSKYWRLALRPYLQFPTGHLHNPDDLIDISTGGQPAIGLYSIHEFYFNRMWSIASSVGYQANIADTVAMRVPNGPDDFLPGPDQLDDSVRRQTGNSIYLEAGPVFAPWRWLEMRAMYDFMEKDPDWYDGDMGLDYSQLSIDTGETVNIFNFQVQLSGVEWFRRHLVWMPFQLGYKFSDTIYAINYPNEISHQLYLRVFF